MKHEIQKESLKSAFAIISSPEHFASEFVNAVRDVCDYLSTEPKEVHYFKNRSLPNFDVFHRESELVDMGLDGKLKYYETKSGDQWCQIVAPDSSFHVLIPRQVLNKFYEIVG